MEPVLSSLRDQSLNNLLFSGENGPPKWLPVLQGQFRFLLLPCFLQDHLSALLAVPPEGFLNRSVYHNSWQDASGSASVSTPTCRFSACQGMEAFCIWDLVGICFSRYSLGVISRNWLIALHTGRGASSQQQSTTINRFACELHV